MPPKPRRECAHGPLMIFDEYEKCDIFAREINLRPDMQGRSTQAFENELNRRRTTAQDNAQRRLENFYAVCPSEAEDVRQTHQHSKSRRLWPFCAAATREETITKL